jgi:hypothetical protein
MSYNTEMVDTANPKINPWQNLADANNFSFVPGSLGGYGQVSGGYHGHHLMLTQMGRSTYIAVFVNHSPRNSRALTNKFDDRANFTVADIFNSLTPPGVLDTLKGEILAGASGQTISYKQSGIEKDTKYLQSVFDLLCNLAEAYPRVASLGGVAVPVLNTMATDKSHKLRRFAASLLQNIASKTSAQLAWVTSDLLCPHCLVYCGPNSLRLPQFGTVTYYGCRACSQSQDLLAWEGWIIAVLDNGMVKEQSQQDKILRANWLIRRELFDFDEVQIVQATDEEVERFAVQVGNDTDAIRKPRYRKMRCTVSTDCQLSANTMRILKRMFGPVKVEKSDQE